MVVRFLAGLRWFIWRWGGKVACQIWNNCDIHFIIDYEYANVWLIILWILWEALAKKYHLMSVGFFTLWSQDMPRLWSAQEIWHFQGAAFPLAGPVPWYSGGADHTRARRIPDPKQRQSKTWGLWWLWLDLATHGVTGENVVCSCLFFQLRFIAEHEPLNCSETCQALLSIVRQYNCQDTY